MFQGLIGRTVSQAAAILRPASRGLTSAPAFNSRRFASLLAVRFPFLYVFAASRDLTSLSRSASAALAETEVRIQCSILSSRHDHAKSARPRKRGGEIPERGRHGSQAGWLAARSVNILSGTGTLLPGAGPSSEPVSLGDCAIS